MAAVVSSCSGFWGCRQSPHEAFVQPPGSRVAGDAAPLWLSRSPKGASRCASCEANGMAGLAALLAPALVVASAASGKRHRRHHGQRRLLCVGRTRADAVVTPLRRLAASDVEANVKAELPADPTSEPKDSAPSRAKQLAEAKVPFFNPWADWMCNHFAQELQLREERLPRHLAHRQGQSDAFAGRFVQTRVFVSDRADSPVRYVRVTLVNNGQQFQAMNAAVYPSFSRGQIPMLSIDLLSFDNHGRQVYGVDWSPMSSTEEYSAEYIAPHVADVRHGTHAHLTCQPTTRFYGEDPEFFSPYLFFARPEGAQAMQPGGPLWDVFMEYCLRYTSMLQRAPSTGSQDVRLASRERQVAYENFHYVNDPAPKLLSRVFGEDWARQFTEQCMYPAKFKQAIFGGASVAGGLDATLSAP